MTGNMTQCEKLFEPNMIGNLTLRNRIVMPAIGTNFAGVDGTVTDRLVHYYSERAKGGVGLLIVESSCIESPRGKLAPIQLYVDDDKFITGLHDLAEAIKSNGAKAAIQLTHAGRQTNVTNTGGIQPVAPSSVPCITRGGQPRELTVNEIGYLVEKYAQGAARAKAAGFDAVEVHGGHGWLIAQFLSPFTNRRKDQYGGSPEGRMRFTLEVLQLTREKVGEHYPIIFKVSGDEFIGGGLRLKDTMLIAQTVQNAGVNAIHVSAGLAESGIWTVQPMAFPRGCLVRLAEGVKRVVDIPVITVGRINDPQLAERILRQGKADLIAMGRALIADPELPRKAADQKFRNIRKCIACNVGCDMRFGLRWPITCTVNPAVGKERESEILRARKIKTVLVIGGGPAGMEAAIIADQRGHRVSLYEENRWLGGQLVLASKPPYKKELKNIVAYLSRQIRKSHVQVVLGEKVTVGLVKKIAPDVVIAATGATPSMPRIPGISRKIVASAWDILKEKTGIGTEIVVIGGGAVGCETAEFLAESQNNVTIISRSSDIGFDMEPGSRCLLKQRFAEKRIKVLTDTDVERITTQGIILKTKDGVKRQIRAYKVVIARGCKPNTTLLEDLQRGFEVYAVGDCSGSRGILEAIHAAFRLAKDI